MDFALKFLKNIPYIRYDLASNLLLFIYFILVAKYEIYDITRRDIGKKINTKDCLWADEKH